MPSNELTLSVLPKTWVFDLDGTILKHNGYLVDGEDTFLGSAKRFLEGIPEEDSIVFLTSRKKEYEKDTVEFLARNGIRYDHIVFGLPAGERILVNDRKPSGLAMAYAVNVDRDSGEFPEIHIDGSL